MGPTATNRASSSSPAPSPARISRRSRIANEESTSSTVDLDQRLLDRFQKPAANEAKSPLKKFQRSATSEGIVRCNSPWEKRKNAMRRRKSSPIKMPNFNWTLESDSDSEDEEEEPPRQRNSGSAWDQRKSALRDRSKSPKKNDTGARRTNKSSSDSPTQSSRWESSSTRSSRSNSPPRERRTSTTGELQKQGSSRWETSSNNCSRSNSPPRERRTSACISGEDSSGFPTRNRRRSSGSTRSASPRLPKRQISNSSDGKANTPSPFSEACGNGDMESLKQKVQIMKSKSDRQVAQTA